MKVRLLPGTIMTGPDGSFTGGDELNLPATVAKSLVDQRKAVQIGKLTGRIRTTPKETATQDAEDKETAVNPSSDR